MVSFVLLISTVAENFFSKLKDVARGLIYVHDQAMIHGDLKGVWL